MVARTILAAFLAAILAAAPAAAQLKVYGPGGPAPAMREAAREFEASTGISVEVVSGPTAEWIDKAKSNADMIYSGSDTMMTDLVRQLPQALDQRDVRPLADRPAAILVRKGNPKKIAGFRDLARPGLKIMVVEGAGQNGLWEDLASRAGGIDFLGRLRANIDVFARNSAEARTAWVEKTGLDAWVIWNIWQIQNPAIADQVAIEPDVLIYRPMAIAVARTSRQEAASQRFAAFLEGSRGRQIFERHGWRVGSSPPKQP